MISYEIIIDTSPKSDYNYHNLVVRFRTRYNCYKKGSHYCLLELGDGCSQKDICKLYSISKQTVNSSVKSLEDKGVLIRKAGVGRDIHLFFTEFGREFSEKHIGPVFDMENATFESMEPSECEQLLSLTRKYVQILKKNMKQYVLEEKEF